MPEAVQNPRPLYEQCTQYRNWRFSWSELEDVRRSTNAHAIETIRTNIIEERNLSGNNQSEEVEYLTADDELALCRFYELKCRDLSRHFRFHDEVMATAILYMKRFYLYNTVMDYNPKDVMLTCIYLATKTQNNHISIDDFLKDIPRTSSDDVLGLEFVVSQGLRFHFAVHHPYLPLHGLFLDMQNVIDDKEALRRVNERAIDLVHQSLFTDLCFVYQPSQIALGLLRMAARENGLDINGYLEGKTKEDTQSLAMLTRICEDIERVMAGFTPTTQETAKDIDRRRRLCLNPAKNPESQLYKKRQQEREKAEEERRQKKLKESTTDFSSVVQ
ncbi:uncharacterized protein VTP21DRAFT_4980 [Calcarisporiella thermophila]|uniref:uncharacterized protein n=1 Tax=Calcarisporiella thermophila TaxID=911321 RepID=UPI0037431231